MIYSIMDWIDLLEKIMVYNNEILIKVYDYL